MRLSFIYDVCLKCTKISYYMMDTSRTAAPPPPHSLKRWELCRRLIVKTLREWRALVDAPCAQIVMCGQKTLCWQSNSKICYSQIVIFFLYNRHENNIMVVDISRARAAKEKHFICIFYLNKYDKCFMYTYIKHLIVHFFFSIEKNLLLRIIFKNLKVRRFCLLFS